MRQPSQYVSLPVGREPHDAGPCLANGPTTPMTNQTHDIGIARQIGSYSDAVEAPAGARWLFTAGTPGLDSAGKLPADIAGQAEIAWAHHRHAEGEIGRASC